VSDTLNFQVPLTAFPLNADRGESGLNVPANGAVPEPNAVAAESSKTVGTPEQSFAPVPKFWPAPPRLPASVTDIPSGPISGNTRSAAEVWVERTLAVTP